MKLIVTIFNMIHRVIRAIRIIFLHSSWKRAGRHVRFSPGNSQFNYENISIGDDVYIGPNATFLTSDSTISIGNKVMFGPGVTILTGDHNYNVVGAFMKDVKEKKPENDLPVVIEDDVWVGAGVIILKGVTIRRGSIVAAGSLVTRDVLPYSIVAGHPARLVKPRFHMNEIRVHEERLYAKDDRLEDKDLEHLIKFE